MTLQQVITYGLIRDVGEICVRDRENRIVAKGRWYQDEVLEYFGHAVEKMSWKVGGTLYVDLM